MPRRSADVHLLKRMRSQVMHLTPNGAVTRLTHSQVRVLTMQHWEGLVHAFLLRTASLLPAASADASSPEAVSIKVGARLWQLQTRSLPHICTCLASVAAAVRIALYGASCWSL